MRYPGNHPGCLVPGEAFGPASDAAWGLLRQALLNCEMGSPGQAEVWARGLAMLPPATSECIPALPHLLRLAGKAWSAAAD